MAGSCSARLFPSRAATGVRSRPRSHTEGVKTVHLGHHFFGAGNLGDDFMLAGFLSALGGRAARLTCCVPRPAGPLARRFPGIDWLPYDDSTRRACIENCDAWLGLGGSPWQAAVSSWFADHLAAELRFCDAAEIGRAACS